MAELEEEIMRTNPRVIDRRELERMLEEVCAGGVSLQAFHDWILKIVVADEIQVDEEDNDLVWTVVYWLDNCFDDSGCDVRALVGTYRRILASAAGNEEAETLLWFPGSRSLLVDSLRSISTGAMTRAEYDALIDQRTSWPSEVRRLMKSLPDLSRDDLVRALEGENYAEVARIVQLR